MHKKEERETGRYPMMSHVISAKKEREGKTVKEVKRPKGINHRRYQNRAHVACEEDNGKIKDNLSVPLLLIKNVNYCFN
jgi:hypothetical protein